MAMAEPGCAAGDDGTLVRASLEGDTQAFARLFARHAGPVGRAVRRRFPGVDGEEVVQEAFVRAWCRLPQLRVPELFGAWVRAIAHSVAADAARAASRHIPLAEVPAAAGAGTDDEVLALRDAVSRLP